MKKKHQNKFVTTNTLVIGIDKWHLENIVNDDFFWLGFPFENSSSKGFIYPRNDFHLKIPIPVIVDLEECSDLNLLSFNFNNSIFFSENWMLSASKVASMIKNITVFKEYRPFTIKKDYIIQMED